MNLELLSKILEIDLKRTKVSRLQDEITDDLQKELAKYLGLIEKKRFTDHQSVEQIKYELGNEIKTKIKLGVQDAYMVGKKYATKIELRPITIQDISQIEKITLDAELAFWNLVSRMEPKLKEFSFDLLASYISSLISDMITKSVNVATISNLAPIVFRPDQIEKQKVVFTTRRDEKVCNICEPLDGTEYEIDDQAKPDIPNDTHPNCRCRYIIPDSI